MAALPEGPLTWDRAARASFFELLDGGGPRSWRFLTTTGVLDRALPELAHALARRQSDPFELDPTGALRWPRLDRLHDIEERRTLEHPEWLLVGRKAVIDTRRPDGAA